MKNKIKKIFPIIILLVIFAPFFAMAADLPPYTLMSGPIPGLSSGEVPTDNAGIATFIVSAYWYIFGLGVALAVLMIVWGGIGYTLKWTEFMTSDSKNRITNAVIGLVILFTSWLLLNTINPALVGFNVNLAEKGCNSPLTGNPGGPPIDHQAYNAEGLLISYDAKGNVINKGGNGGITLSGNTGLSGPARSGETAAQALLRNAQSAADQSNPLITGSRIGCAVAMNGIAQIAFGHPIGGGASPQVMLETMKTYPDKYEEVGKGNEQPGDIIISAQSDNSEGKAHVGVYKENGVIISNSSSKEQVAENFYLDRTKSVNQGSGKGNWEATYGAYHVFRPKDSVIIKTPPAEAAPAENASSGSGGR